MTEPIDYAKCKTDRTGLYIMVFLLLLSGPCSSNPSTRVLNTKLDRIEAMKPCSQEQVK
jgi:hypothetical protein